MSAILYRVNEKKEVVSEKVPATDVHFMLGNNWFTSFEEAEKASKPKRKAKDKKEEE